MRDLSPLAGLGSLRRLTLERCPWIEDLSALCTLPALESVRVNYAGGKSVKIPPELEGRVTSF